jgi:hypothetical protein
MLEITVRQAREMAPPFPVPLVFPEVDAAVLAYEAAEDNRSAPPVTEQNLPLCR